MGNFITGLNSAGQALDAFQHAIDVTQGNVVNANSPGYARQVPALQSLDDATGRGSPAGVTEITQDSRNQFAETAVQQQLGLLGQYQQLQSSLAPLQTVFDVSSSSAIPSALNQLFQSFSQWSAQPNDPTVQTSVINAAQQTASAFQQAAAQLTSIRSSLDVSLGSTVAQINQDAATIQDFNNRVAAGDTADAGLQARLYSALDDLSGLADVQVLPGNGATITVLLGGQTPLVIGNQLNALQVANDTSNAGNGPVNVKIVDSTGADVTGHISSGSLYGLLTVRNNILPSLAGGGQQTGGLNTLAQGLADAVNNLLAQGSTTSTPPYQAGVPMFTYNAGSPSGVAASLSVNPALTPSQLAPVDPGPPLVSNGVALKLAGLDSAPGGQINGLSFTQYFGSLVSSVGNAASSANTAAAAQAQVVTQAKNLRQQLSGVSLDDEAVRLIQLQSSYQAVSKLVTVVDDLTKTLINMVQ